MLNKSDISNDDDDDNDNINGNNNSNNNKKNSRKLKNKEKMNGLQKECMDNLLEIWRTRIIATHGDG